MDKFTAAIVRSSDPLPKTEPGININCVDSDGALHYYSLRIDIHMYSLLCNKQRAAGHWVYTVMGNVHAVTICSDFMTKIVRLIHKCSLDSILLYNSVSIVYNLNKHLQLGVAREDMFILLFNLLIFIG